MWKFYMSPLCYLRPLYMRYTTLLKLYIMRKQMDYAVSFSAPKTFHTGKSLGNKWNAFVIFPFIQRLFTKGLSKSTIGIGIYDFSFAFIIFCFLKRIAMLICSFHLQLLYYSLKGYDAISISILLLLGMRIFWNTYIGVKSILSATGFVFFDNLLRNNFRNDQYLNDS